MNQATTRIFCLLILTALFFLSGCAATAHKTSGGVNTAEQKEKPYLVLVSFDGFRHDYQELYDTPAMDRLAENGVRAKALIPVFPTLTFPNHYTIATGLYPARHGIVANAFPGEKPGEWFNYKDPASAQDGKWFGGEPVWVAAEKQGMVTASYFFVGTEADIQGVRPSHWYRFDRNVSGEDRVDQVLEWLALPAETRPHLVTLYFEDVDDKTHRYGIGSDESIAAIEQLDNYLGRLMDGLDALPHGKDTTIVLVSDHGQGSYDLRGNTFILDTYFNLDGMRFSEGGPYLFVHMDEENPERVKQIRDRVNDLWICGHALLPENAPGAWRVNDNPRYPDLILVARPGCAVVSTVDIREEKINPGDHGWPPGDPDMSGIFIAAGPRLPRGKTIGRIKNVDVYPLLMEVLELEPNADVDSNPAVLTGLLSAPAAE